MAAYRRYQDGFLPGPGGIGAQPALLIQAFDQVGLIKGILDEEDMNKARSGNQSSPSGNEEGWVSLTRGQ